MLLPACAIVCACIALGLALLARQRLADETRLESARASALQQVVHASAGASVPACTAEVGYVQALPTAISLDRLVQTLQESAKAFDVRINSVSGEPHAATGSTLAALDVNISMHGSYAGIKAVLAEGLARFPTGVMTHLHVKRDGLAAVPIEEATAQVSFALRPSPASPLACRLEAAGLAAKGGSK